MWEVDQQRDVYEQKWALLNRNMRWEVADLLREHYLPAVNAACEEVHPRDSFYTAYGKRALDIAVAAVALGATLPVNAVIALVTLVDLGRPIFFRQQRIGKGGEKFTLVKFRNMREAFDENGHPLPGAMRVTKLGKIMRRTSLDELLNFWSILKGDMSLIGPRPLVPEYFSRYSVRHRARTAVKPGLECPPRSGRLPASYDEQFENDVWYVENSSFAVDISLMIRLVQSVLDREDSKKRSASVKGSFMGYDENGAAVDSHSVPMWAIDTVLRRHGLLGSAGRE
ncbi:sugar transferase [Brevibacterium senegalense]|uniref:sugar transferase n=1 Tax=Brevibacterium senegalense TaxID=1033736 RepID=UPI001375CF88|nr:sugar transferase [Brevibacterium senegalense]